MRNSILTTTVSVICRGNLTAGILTTPILRQLTTVHQSHSVLNPLSARSIFQRIVVLRTMSHDGNKIKASGVDTEPLINTPGKSEDSNNASPSTTVVEKQLGTREKLKVAIRDYGGTVLVFHVTMSLMSLGSCYLLVSSGLDIIGLLSQIGISETLLQSKITQGGSTFVLAYAIHKVFAPVRLGITLTCVPFIVKKLRNIGFLKQPS